MTLVEARTRLGLEPAGGLEKADLRRAYLQAIKRSKPEVDPEGFKAVREAYELLDGLLRMGVQLVEPPPSVPPVVPSTPVPAPELPAGAPSPPVDNLKPYRQKLDQLFGAPWRQRVEVGWEAYGHLPEDPAAREFLLELLPIEARSDIISVLLDGVRQGDQSCLLRLLHFAPASLPDEILARLETEGNPFERVLVATALIGRDQPDRALELLDQVLDQAAGQLPDPLLIEGTLRLSLRFDEKSDPARADRVRARLRKYLGGPGLPADAATPTTAATYALASELEAASYLPLPVRAEIARGALEGEWSRLPSAVAEAEATLGQGSFERKMGRLRVEAPALSALLHQHRVVRVDLTEDSSPGWSRWLWLILPIVVGLVRMMSNGGGEPRYTPPPRVVFNSSSGQLPSFADIPTIQVGNTTEPGQSMSRILELQQEAMGLCRDSLDTPVCKKLPAFLRKLDGDTSCGVLVAELVKLQQAARSTPAQKEFLQRLTSDVPGSCKP